MLFVTLGSTRYLYDLFKTDKARGSDEQKDLGIEMYNILKRKNGKEKKFAVGRGRVHVHVSSFASICQGTFISAASLYKDLAVA
jgi:hypothetical protein